MALITIIVQDSPDGAQVSVTAEPQLPAAKPGIFMSPAQAAALTMLNALRADVKPSSPIQLLS